MVMAPAVWKRGWRRRWGSGGGGGVRSSGDGRGGDGTGGALMRAKQRPSVRSRVRLWYSEYVPRRTGRAKSTVEASAWVRRRRWGTGCGGGGWKMVMAMAKAACEAADRVAPTMGPWWRSGDGDNGGSSEREEVQRWPSRARKGRARTVERVGRAKG